uniref:aminotransferase class V-fold PLP-dependent enzyme n=1 Tax=Sphingomonas bacterium TaxID=1895847 RepID=UPI00261CBA5E|nr:aminotransferase class V-fold PLP-dependent enzyme [Sphingomonas bacterium]
MVDYTRRALLGAIGLAMPVQAALAANVTADPRPEYGFAPGLTYLNTAALGPTPLSVRARMDAAWIELERNPVFETYGDGPLHLQSDRAREEVAALLGCRSTELLITRSTTDAMNILVSGMQLAAGDRVLLTDQEHEGGTYCWTNLARRRGIIIDTISIAPEDHDPAAIVARFARAIRPGTKVVSVSHVISATGYFMPIPEIAALARANGMLCMVDGAQAFGQIPVDVKALGCHAYAAPGHKWLMGPKGTGVLYLDPDTSDRIEPVQIEGGHRFISNSTGVGCLPLCIGLGAAAEAMRKRDMAAVRARTLDLRNLAYEGLTRIPGLRLASAPPGPAATALVAAYLPDAVDSFAFRAALLTKHQMVVKMAEKTMVQRLPPVAAHLQ